MACIEIVDLEFDCNSFFCYDLIKLSQEQQIKIQGGFNPGTPTPNTPVTIALRGFPGWGYALGAFMGGFQFGEWLNENTPIQQWISELIGS